MKPLKIAYLLKKKMTQQELADELGVTQSAVNQVIHDHGTRSKKIQDRICDIIGKPSKEVFG